MNTIKKQIETTVVELTKEQFQQLTADMIPASANEIRDIAMNILADAKYNHANMPEMIEATENCRRFLNTQHMLREMMQAFKEDKTE